MTFGVEAIHWGMVADGVQIGLGLVILVFLVHGRLRSRRRAAADAAEGPKASFGDEVLLQSLRQRAETALAAVAAAVEAERIGLQQFCDGGRKSRRAEQGELVAAPAPFRLGQNRCDAAAAARDSGYEGIGGLAAAGLSARQIAEQLNLPAGEVELVLKLHGAPHSATA